MKDPIATQAYLSAEEMRKINDLLPADYLLVLSPHEELWNQVKAIKEKFATDYNCGTARSGLPHITLATFRQQQVFETRITQRLRNIARNLSAFKVELKDFGSFPSHTIYINIVSKVQIMDAVKALRAPQKLMKPDNDHKPYFSTEPHLTIARKLQPWQYEKGWLEYEHQHFHGRFIADHTLLLKRRAGETFKVVEKFMFEGTRAAAQASLF
ncbi:MAG TPA: 2'-5' RNA ligase family protein [Panacibacter sp.]|nr:2'-5' RNA ligase family protein [Panacibacter sp.]HNP46310.1 2'-5' RNA ligase family protein [Panacibacter sp.]